MCRTTRTNTPDAPPWPLGSTPAGRKERLAAAAALQAVLPVLGRISTAHVAHLCREWFLAGWTPADILAALGRRPDGTPWHHDHDIRHVPGWWRHRMTAWRHDPTSPPGRSPSTRRAAELAHARAAARARAERRAIEAARVEAADITHIHAHADAVRAEHRKRWPRRPRR